MGSWRLTAKRMTVMSESTTRAEPFEASALLLIAGLPIMAALVSASGRVLLRTDRWSEYLGIAPGRLDEAVHLDAVDPEYRDALRGLLGRYVATDEAGEIELPIRAVDGTYRWFLMQLAPLAAEPGCRSSHAFVALVDVDQRRRAEAALREQLAFSERLLAASDDCIKTLDLQGRLLTINEVGRVALELGDGTDVVGRRWSDSWSGAERAVAVDAVERAVGGGVVRFTAEIRSIVGRRSTWDVSVSPIVGIGGMPERLLVISRNITEQRATEDARRIAIARLELLVTTDRVLASSLDYTTTLNNIARLAVETIADACLFDIVGDDGEPALVAVAHAEPEHEALMGDAGRHLESDPDRGEHYVRTTLRTGRSVFVPLTDPTWIVRSSSGTVHERFMTALEYRSLIVVAVRNGDVSLGTLTLVLAGPRGRLFDGSDLAFAEELGRRAGVALENARLYTRERHVATALQEASLPTELPQLEHMSFDASYRAGSSEATIGGDWYDAFVLRDGRVALTVGDVLGSGLKAAVIMTKLRQAMQSAALIVADPNVMLDAAEQTLRLHAPDGIATAIAAIFDPTALTLCLASAGHPGPAVRYRDGTIEEIAVPGILLGLRDHPDEVQSCQLAAGDTVVFYTDGLVEATRDIDEGIARLHAALGQPEIYAARHPARPLMDAVLPPGGATDDTAVLVIRIF